MKRLNLEAFKTNNLTTTPKEQTDLLLGKTLGNCHDGKTGPGGGTVLTGRPPIGIDDPFGPRGAQ